MAGVRWCTRHSAALQGILVELSLVPLYGGQHLWWEVIERLEAVGFTLWAPKPVFSDQASGRTLQIDGVFTELNEPFIHGKHNMNKLLGEIGGDFPKVSIGIVVFNGIAHIRNCLDSVTHQSYKNIELIVVDGDSKDGTQDVLKEYAEQIAVLVSEPDKGIYDAMNKVCSLATGDWLIFLGCDDVLLDTLSDIVKVMHDSNTIYYGDVILRSNSKIYGGKFTSDRLFQQNFCHQSVFYPRCVYKTHQYSLQYKALADYAYNLKLFGSSLVSFSYLNKLVAIFNDQGFSSHGDVDFYRDRVRLIYESFGLNCALRVQFVAFRKSFINFSVVFVGGVMKRVLPKVCWKHLQSLWRRLL
ncbi:MAG: glycosyltransferase family 2 protein [Sulfuriferula sp.]